MIRGSLIISGCWGGYDEFRKRVSVPVSLGVPVHDVYVYYTTIKWFLVSCGHGCG